MLYVCSFISCVGMNLSVLDACGHCYICDVDTNMSFCCVFVFSALPPVLVSTCPLSFTFVSIALSTVPNSTGHFASCVCACACIALSLVIPKGSWGCLSPPCLESRACHLIPPYCLSPLSVCCLLPLFFLSCHFSANCPILLTFFFLPENSSIFLVKR